jgi:amino acid adenylation domain-containing protein
MNVANEQGLALSAKQKRKLLGHLLRQQTTPITIDYPLSHGQRALWFIYKMDRQSPAYNIMCAAHVRADVDCQALQQAFQTLIRRHATLRTTYATVDDVPVQRVHLDWEVQLNVLDRRGFTGQQFSQCLEQEANRPFDLECGPVFRIQLLQQSGPTWVLLFTAAHIATDFWSFDLLFDELKQLYRANMRETARQHSADHAVTSQEQQARLAHLKHFYRDYVEWQGKMLNGPAGARMWDYWRKQLAGELPSLNLPTDNPRPPLQSYQGRSYLFRLPDRLTRRLFCLARDENATPFMTLLAAFQILLYRYSGQRDILVGSPTAGRSHAEFEPLVGYFLNPVVFRCKLQPEDSFRQFPSQVRQTVLDGLTHQDFPFPLLVERLQPRRDPSRTPVFQASFSWDKPRTEFTLDETRRKTGGAQSEQLATFKPPVDPTDLGLRPFALGQQGAAFDLTLMMLSTDESLTAALQYNSRLFEEATIARMAEHFETLLQNIVDKPDQALENLPVLSEHWARKILSTWNQTEAAYPENLLLHQLFEQQAREHPDRIAACHGTREWTYRELNHRANRLARWLVSQGAGMDRHVGIAMEPSLEMLQGILAVHKAGGAYLPLASGTPVDRIISMLEQSGTELVLAQRSRAAELPDFTGVLLCLDEEQKQAHHQHDHTELDDNLALPLDSMQLAYTIFTSGSTGGPKGVQIPHRPVVNLLCSMHREPGIVPEDKLLSVTSPGFDISVLELYLPLVTGASVVLVDREVAADGQQLAAALAGSGASMVKATPATWRMLIEAGWQGDPRLKALCGGETLTRDLADRLIPLCGGLWNMYGPTETTIWSAIHPVSMEPGPVLIGRPVANTQFYVIDELNRPVPVGIPGELLISGHGLARGYLNDPGLTARKFIPHPFLKTQDARAYKTGDQARYRADGILEFLGRNDLQLKIRGCRIEPREIETILERHPRIKESLVVAQPTASHSNEKRLVSYVVTTDHTPPDARQLREFLRQQLPDYMLPAVFIELDVFPLTQAGKVDRNALPVPGNSRPALQDGYTAPREGAEVTLAKIWARVLGIDRVGRDDNFFDLGGTSMMSLEIASIAGNDGLVITPAQLFRHPTLSSLAAALKLSSKTARASTSESSTQATMDNANTGIPGNCSAPDNIPVTASNLNTIVRSNNHHPLHTPPSATSPVLRDNTRSLHHTCSARISSMGVYLPPGVVTTEELIQDCKPCHMFPLENVTGIQSRRMVDGTEFSSDLACKAVRECLANSPYSAEQIDMIVCCNITRSSARLEISMEPNTSMQVKRECGLTHALAFDVSNACAGMFTGMLVVDSFLTAGHIRRGLVVSGEYTSGIIGTAQQEITEYLDPRLASLTVGDAGAAVLLESSGKTGAGFHELDMYTLGKYSRMCIGQMTDGPHGGAIIMRPDPIEHTAIAVRHSAANLKYLFDTYDRDPESIDHLIMHQTSAVSLLDGSRAINKCFGKEISTARNTINNLAHRGNTASTSHIVAVWDHIQNGRIKSGDKTVFSITGSGQTIGTATYTFDDLPDRMRSITITGKKPEKHTAEHTMQTAAHRYFARVQISATGLFPDNQTRPDDTVETAACAARDCLAKSAYEPCDIDLLIFAGVTRTNHVFEPAIASMVAEKLNMNDSIDSEIDRKTLAFDVFNGAMSFMNGCHIASEMIYAGKYRTAMVVASEVETNKPHFRDRLLGLAETGGAVILDSSPSGQVGFSPFIFHYDLEHFEAREVIGRYVEGKLCMCLQENEHLHELYLQTIPAAVNDLLAREGLTMSQVTHLIPPQISQESNYRLARHLGIDSHRVIDRAVTGHDLYTSGMARSLEYLRKQDLSKTGDIGLIIQVSSGIQAGCVAYYF